jgi:hypothetical protein
MTHLSVTASGGERNGPQEIQRPRGQRGRWMGQVSRDLLLVIAGALLALAGDEWRDARHRRSEASDALVSIRDELRRNAELVARARDHHRARADTLAKLAQSHLSPPVAIYSNGMFNPAVVSSTAWQAARETGALGNLPLSLVLALAPAYEAQERYRSLGDAMLSGIMTDVRHDGMETVLRDRFPQFIALDIDFGNREGVLLDHYRRALERTEGLQ